jgi:hypothetical protein
MSDPPKRKRRVLRAVGLGFLGFVVVLAGLVAFVVYRPISRRAGSMVASAQAPDFSLPDQADRVTTLASLTAQGPAVLVFYRGFW